MNATWGLLLSILFWAAHSAPAADETVAARDLYYEAASEKIGLKCRVLVKALSGRFVGVPPDSVFRSNDAIRLEVESNTNGFLYIAAQGSDGSWYVLFPSAELEDSRNRIHAFQPVEIPGGQEFYFDEVPGKERVFVVVSKQEERELRELLDKLRRRKQTAGVNSETDQAGSLLTAKMAAELHSRNLRISRIEGKEAGAPVRHAVYAVNMAPAEGRLVLEIELNHER